MWAVELNCRKEVVWLAINIRKKYRHRNIQSDRKCIPLYGHGTCSQPYFRLQLLGLCHPTPSDTVQHHTHDTVNTSTHGYIYNIYRAISTLKNSISNPDPKPHILRLHQKSIGIEFHLASAGDHKAKSDEQQGPGRCVQNIRKI